MSSSIPTRKSIATLEAVRVATGSSFDADAWHVMDARDTALIEDELLNGSGSNKFVYDFRMAGGEQVSGISVIGARHLAYAYGGIKHRLVASIQKTGSLFTFQSFPAPEMPMSVHVQDIPELENEEDFYGAVVEITDVKRGNVIQVEKRESRWGVGKNGRYEKMHYATIAQSKAFRNGVLSLVPQDTQTKWKLQQLSLGKSDTITVSVIAEKRQGIARFAASKGLAIDRKAVEALTMDQISGLSDAARAGPEAFLTAAGALQVLVQDDAPEAVTKLHIPRLGEGSTKSAPGELKSMADMEQRSQDVSRETSSRGESQPESQVESKSDAPPPFSAWLVDEVGEVAGDEVASPVAFARALGVLWEATPKTSQAAIMENNHESVVAAAQGDSQAADIIRDLQRLTKASPDKLRLGIPQSARGGPAWPGYLKAIKEALVKLNREDLGAWVDANLADMLTAPEVQRLSYLKFISDFANAVGGTAPASLQQLAQANQPTEDPRPRERDRTWATRAAEEIAGFSDLNQLKLWREATTQTTVMNRLERESTDLFEAVQGAYLARLETLDSVFPMDRP